MSVIVTLDEQELGLIQHVAETRHQGERPDWAARKWNGQKFDMTKELHAAAAEYAVACVTGVKWNSLHSKFREGLPDLADGSEVKWAQPLHYNLVVNPLKDGSAPKQNVWYYLVLGNLPELHVFGKCWGRKLFSDKYKDPFQLSSPGWLVPQSDLRPVTLKDVRYPSPFLNVREGD